MKIEHTFVFLKLFNDVSLFAQSYGPSRPVACVASSLPWVLQLRTPQLVTVMNGIVVLLHDFILESARF
jgi:hypothetical protein